MKPDQRIATSVLAKLLNLSRERSEDLNLLHRRYCLERFLYRLSLTPHRSRMILKGAMLFQIWSKELLRPTGDMDFLARGEVTPDTIANDIRQICSVEVEDDGLRFDLTNLKVARIREQTEYGGTRASFTALLGSARVPMQIDFGIGDVVTPSPQQISYPALLSMPEANILAYPRETVIAEKLNAIVTLGFDNSRMKDYFDLWFFATTFPENRSMIASAVKATFAHREQKVPTSIPDGLSDEFATDPAKATQWKTFQRKLSTSLELAQVVRIVREFAMEIFAEASK